MSDHAGHAVSSRERGGLFYSGEPEDRAALERQIAGTQASIQGRLRRIENEVGSAPKAVWAGAKKHPALSALVALAAGLLIGKMIFRKRRHVSRTTQPTGMYGSPAASGGSSGLFHRFWATLLQTGIGLAADFAADFLAGRSGAALRGFRRKTEGDGLEEDVPRDKGEKTYGKS
ncbi:MAG: hypothetical protein F4Y00_09060 [Bacteroidetes bacterium SB0662_bin_6]|nr:hypothetical protein [Bacteroidetes bacterium SB0668_bin_1]MYE05102.1 hypothetical protein [Bacteroidetes bacterium SB0662_bin_6]